MFVSLQGRWLQSVDIYSPAPRPFIEAEPASSVSSWSSPPASVSLYAHLGVGGASKAAKHHGASSSLPEIELESGWLVSSSLRLSSVCRVDCFPDE